MEQNRFLVLDGWRGISILLVLATHLLPLGPKAWHLNVASGLLGMALFFVLSGFLVTHFLVNSSHLCDFIIRRFFRIIPLVWLYITISFLFFDLPISVFAPHYFFYANYSIISLLPITDHLWSLCVEVHFYIGIIIVIGILKRRGLLVIPVICILITSLRIANEMYFSVITHFRIDEILAGSVLALIYNNMLLVWLKRIICQSNWIIVVLLLLVSSHENSGFANYFRPYLAALLIGPTIFNNKSTLSTFLSNRPLIYIASISYALYIIHPLLTFTWLGSGEDLAKYVKRPLLFIVLFSLAHISTFYYEKKWISFGRILSNKLSIYFKPESNAAVQTPVQK